MENIKEIQFDTNTKDKILEILSRHNFKNELEFRIGELNVFAMFLVGHLQKILY